jgi:ribosomal protein S12 methylthiotransferase accessory factor
MTTLDLLDLDLSGDAAAQLRAAIAHRHGASLANAMAMLDQLILIRSPWAIGLRFVGGRLKAPVGATGSTAAHNVAGSGIHVEDAFASCFGEAVERSAQMRAPRQLIRTAGLGASRSSFEKAVAGLIGKLTTPCDNLATAAFEWLEGRSLDGDIVRVPVDWCLRRPNHSWLRIPGAALSVGCAAGPTLEMAATRALLELIERDAASLWWNGARHARQLHPHERSEANETLATVRGDASDRVTVLLDITTELGMPVIAAISTDQRGSLFAAGLGARITRAAAIRAAVIELCQMEVGLQLALRQKETLGEQALSDDDLRHLARATAIDIASDRRFAMDEPLQSPTPADDSNELACVRDAFTRAGFQAALIDLTRPEIEVPVVKAIAPDLQLLPSTLITSRLQGRLAQNREAGNAIADIPLV